MVLKTLLKKELENMNENSNDYFKNVLKREYTLGGKVYYKKIVGYSSCEEGDKEIFDSCQVLLLSDKDLLKLKNSEKIFKDLNDNGVTYCGHLITDALKTLGYKCFKFHNFAYMTVALVMPMTKNVRVI